MSDETKKLKRGLKELSSLFRDNAFLGEASVPRQLPASIDIDCISVFDFRGHSDSSRLLSFCASKLAHFKNLCSLVSIAPSHLFRADTPSSPKDRNPDAELLEEEFLGHYFNRFSLSWEQFDAICRSSQQGRGGYRPTGVHQTLFLDFDYDQVPHFQKIIPVLDKCVLVARACAENITETYKMVKATAVLNPELDYYFVYDGLSNDSRGEVLFERLSGMIARRLGIQLGWLGYFHADQQTKRIFENLNYEFLFLNRKNKTESIEKFILAELVRPAVQAETVLAV